MSLEETLRQIVREEISAAVADVVAKVVVLRNPASATPTGDEYLAPATVARAVGVDVKTVRRWIQAGSLRAGRAGRKLRVRRSDLDAFISRRKTNEGQPTADELASKLLGRGR